MKLFERFDGQGVVTPISTVLRAVTRHSDPVYGGCRCGLPYFPIFYKRVTQIYSRFCHSYWVTGSLVVWSCSHQQFSSVVTQSRTIIGRSLTVTPCSRSSKYVAYWSDHPLLVSVSAGRSAKVYNSKVCNSHIVSTTFFSQHVYSPYLLNIFTANSPQSKMIMVETV